MTHIRFSRWVHSKIWIILAAAIVVFLPALKTYFLQDDWRFLSLTTNRPWLDVFIYYPRAIYRPIGQQLFFWTGDQFFGLNPVGFHLLSLLIHLMNIYLLWRVIGNFPARTAATLWYAISPIHVVSLNWLTQVDLELTVTFSLLAVILSSKRYWIERLGGLLVYILALLSHEVSVFLPVAIIIIIVRRATRADLMYFVSWLIFGISILISKYLINPFPLDEDYRVAGSIIAWLKQLAWYWWRAAGVVEGIRSYSQIVMLCTAVLMGVFVLKFRRAVLPASGLFFLGILPVLGLSHHPLAAYATIGLTLMSIWLGRNSQNSHMSDWIYIPVVVATATIVSWSVIVSHWTTVRGEISRSVTEKIQALNPGGQLIHIASENIQINRDIYFATLEGSQLKVLLNNPSLEVTFEAFTTQPNTASRIVL